MRRVIFTTACVTALTCFSWAGRTAEEKEDAQKLEGTWVEAHALAKDKPKGRGGYYAWAFKGDQVVRAHTQTIDGEPVTGSSHRGTYKLDPAAKPKTIDIVLKSPLGEDWKYLGIYEFDGDTLKLCLAKDKRPAKIDRKDGNYLYVLKRPPKK